MQESDLGYLREALQKNGLQPSDRQIEQFSLYYDLLIKWNEKINLTAITEPKEVIRKHFLDSLLIGRVSSVRIAGRAADVGTGAGFPGIPLAVMYPELETVLIDSLGKRVSFLQLCIDEMGLKKVTAVKARAEEIGRDVDFRENFDLVFSRAVAALPVLSEYCLPLVKPGGVFAAYKSVKAAEESRQAEHAVGILGGVPECSYSCTLEGTDEERTILLFRKSAPTPEKYPRKAGIPAKRPLA